MIKLYIILLFISISCYLSSINCLDRDDDGDEHGMHTNSDLSLKIAQNYFIFDEIQSNIPKKGFIYDQADTFSKEMEDYLKSSSNIQPLTILDLSALPSSTPTAFPSATPTATPTSIPTARPTQVPTGIPTSYPSAIPSIMNAKPSLYPTEETSPTHFPTTEMSPTHCPTSKSSSTLKPTRNSRPSHHPTSEISPTHRPTAYPTEKRSKTPSPTAMKTSQPTSHPSPSPSSVGSIEPSSADTSAPSSAVSVSPSALSTNVPSSSSTTSPSATSSSNPSSIATDSPTASPSAAVTAAPVAETTFSPSAIPTGAATANPSFKRVIPTFKPTTQTPTLVPTLGKGETYRPTVSNMPTSAPTFAPAVVRLLSKQSMAGISRSQFLNDSNTVGAFCDSVKSVILKRKSLGDLSCSVTGVADDSSGSSVRLLAGGISIDYVMSFLVAISSGSTDTSALLSLANDTAKALASGLAAGDFNTAWQAQLSEYGITSDDLFAATSFSVSTSAEVIIPTSSPTPKPTTLGSVNGSSNNKRNIFVSGPYIALWVIIAVIVAGGIAFSIYYFLIVSTPGMYEQKTLDNQTQVINMSIHGHNDIYGDEKPLYDDDDEYEDSGPMKDDSAHSSAFGMTEIAQEQAI